MYELKQLRSERKEYLMTVNDRPEFRVSPSAGYLVMSAVMFGAAVVLGVFSHYSPVMWFVFLYRYVMLPVLTILCLWGLLFFVFRRIYVYKTGMTVCFVRGWRQHSSFEDLSKVEFVFSGKGYDVPVRIFVGDKKVITVTASYRGYELLMHELEKKCKGKIVKV